MRHIVTDLIVVKDSKILLEKRASDKLTEAGKYCLPGGHMNRDELIWQCGLRELKEETGYDGKITQLFVINDNPNRRGEDRQNVAFVFVVEVDYQISQPDGESELVDWFDLDRLPAEKEFGFDHYEIIQLYKKYLQTGKRPQLLCTN